MKFSMHLVQAKSGVSAEKHVIPRLILGWSALSAPIQRCFEQVRQMSLIAACLAGAEEGSGA